MKQEAAATRAATTAPDRAWIPHLRWYICGLLFLAATINYLDRQTLSVLKNDLSRELNWSEAAYGWINFAFQLAYAVMQGLSGRLVDWLGVRLCFAVAVVVWSLAAMGHAMARGVVGFAIARLMLGLGEGANFPASIKAVAEWFPKKERALATGIFNSGTNVGVMIAPIAVWLAHAIHWQAAFLFTGVVGFGWLILWLKFYRSPQEHPRLDPEELKFIESDVAPAATEEQAMRIPWIYLLRYRQAWAFFIGKFLTDPVWWFYLYWLPSYLSKERGFSAMASASVLIIPYLAADGGSVFGGLLSSLWIKRGWSVANARLTAMLITAMCMPAAIWAVLTDKGWLSLALISLATAAHQGWSANLFTTSSDLFPKRIVASVVGLGICLRSNWRNAHDADRRRHPAVVRHLCTALCGSGPHASAGVHHLHRSRRQGLCSSQYRGRSEARAQSGTYRGRRNSPAVGLNWSLCRTVQLDCNRHRSEELNCNGSRWTGGSRRNRIDRRTAHLRGFG